MRTSIIQGDSQWILVQTFTENRIQDRSENLVINELKNRDRYDYLQWNFVHGIQKVCVGTTNFR